MDEVENDGIEDRIEGRRPVPVRAVMEASEPGEGNEGQLPRQFIDPGTNQEWVARISGRSTSGVLPLRVIPLMELSFSVGEAPEIPVRRAIYQGQSMDDLDDAGLLLLFRSAGPFESLGPERDRPPRNERREPGGRGPRR